MKQRAATHSFQSALVALIVSALQLVGVFHLALVPHAYSAAGGGLMHVHRAPRALAVLGAAAAQGRAGVQPATLSIGSASSLAELCPLANAPPVSSPRIECLVSGWASFGAGVPLREPAQPSSKSTSKLLTAPKTSPPV